MSDLFEDKNSISEATVTIRSDSEPFKVGCLDGNAITGVIDVEKFVKFDRMKFFIEKKLPFQILIIAAPEPKPEHKY